MIRLQEVREIVLRIKLTVYTHEAEDVLVKRKLSLAAVQVTDE